MSVLVPQSTSFFFSSDPANKAQNVSADGSQFTVVMDAPISLPHGAMGATLSVSQASIWNTSYNISAAFGNNVFAFQSVFAPGVGPLVPIAYSILIPDGLYSLSGFNAYLSTQFVNLRLPSNLITVNGDDATQKTILTFLLAGDQVDFAAANSVRGILGFDARLAPVTAQPAGYNEFSDEPANFNRVNSYLITSNFVSQGIPVNSIGQGIIAQIPITVPPGSQINYQPRNPIPVDASELVGVGKNAFTFSLVDQNLRATPTAGETWNFVLVLNYFILLTGDRVLMSQF
jgi:hypothetical protein